MTTPVAITFRNTAVTSALNQEIQARIAWLEAFQPHIKGCRVVFDVPHRHPHHGREICVEIEVALPKGPVHVHHRHAPGGAPPASAAGAGGFHQEAVEAIREAFHVARRRVSEAMRRPHRD